MNEEVGVKWNINPHLLLLGGGVRPRTIQCASAGPEQPGILHPVGRNRIHGFETAPERLRHRQLAVLARLRLYRCPRDRARRRRRFCRAIASSSCRYNQFSWWNKYQFNAGVGSIRRCDLLLGPFASSDDSVKLPGFFRFDAGVFAKINENWRAQLNIENVFNKGYWASADGNNNITPGQPRTVRLTAFAKF